MDFKHVIARDLHSLAMRIMEDLLSTGEAMQDKPFKLRTKALAIVMHDRALNNEPERMKL